MMNPHLFARVVALILLLTGIFLWANHHLGIAPGNLGWLSVPTAILAGVAAWVDKLLEDPERQSILRTARDKLRAALSMQVLVVLFLLAFGLGLVYSSVMVIPDSNDPSASISITPADRLDRKHIETLDPKEGVRRFRVVTSPFGRPFRIELEGYAPETLDVYPFVGLKVRAGKELRRSPSLLLRLPPVAVASLKNGGKLVVIRRIGNDGETLATDTEPRSAFLVGRAHSIPPSSYGIWRMELQAAGSDERGIAQSIMGWSRPKVLRPLTTLEPGMMILAEVRSRANKRVASAEMSLGNDSLIDIGLEEVFETEGSP
jgi:hypothetical protein